MSQCNHEGPNREAGGSASEKETRNRSRLGSDAGKGP